MPAITPQEVRQKAGSHIPPQVIDVVNDLILKNVRIYENRPRGFTSYEVRLEKDEVVKAIEDVLGKCETHWLDFEPIFRRAGWDVVYDRPAYNEMYNAFYTFTSRLQQL